MKIGISLALTAMRQGGGAWAGTKQRLREQILTYGRAPAVMTSPPTVTINASSQISGTVTLVEDATKRRIVGGNLYKMPFDGTNWGQFLGVTYALADPQQQMGGSVERLFTGDAFEINVAGNAAQFRLWVEDELVQTAPFVLPGDGAYAVLVDFGATVTNKKIRLDLQYGTRWDGDKVKAGQSVIATAPANPLIFGFVSDSFGETTPNSGGHYGIDGWVGRMVHDLGVQRYFNSSTGGTSMANPNGGRVSGLDRFQRDILDQGVDVLTIAMGINADSAANELAAIQSAVSLFRAAKPQGLVNIITPWDSWMANGEEMGVVPKAITDGLKAMPLDGGMFLTDMYRTGFTIAGSGDLTHPAGNGYGATPGDGYTTIGNKTVQTAKTFAGV